MPSIAAPCRAVPGLAPPCPATPCHALPRRASREARTVTRPRLFPRYGDVDAPFEELPTPDAAAAPDPPAPAETALDDAAAGLPTETPKPDALGSPLPALTLMLEPPLWPFAPVAPVPTLAPPAEAP